jgi:plasmid maintenance system antidote protein VapI
MAIHIGNIIKKEISSSGISVTDFANKINYSRRNLYEIFEKETIDTGVLIKISKVLGTNLFVHYLSESDLETIRKENSSIENFQELIETLRLEIDRLKTSSKEEE